MKVAILLARRPDQLGEWLADARAFEAAGADALWVDLDPASGLDPLVLLAALAALTHRALLVAALPAAERPSEEGDPEHWVQVPAPEGRAAWRAALADAAAAGTHGLLVPAGPRLLDILRNPDDPDGRQDLQLAQG